MSKTIIEKLNLLKYEKKAVLDKPEGIDELSGLEPYDLELKDGGYELIFAFVLDIESLHNLVNKVIDNNHLVKGGYLYAAYPKKGNKVYPTHIDRDRLFEGVGADESGYIGTSSLKFARMVGLDDVFTVVGFKEEPRSLKTASSKPSQRVDEYAAMIPKLEEDLRGYSEVLAFYQSLTPGYRKDWARYVYSAVQEETRTKRLEEMRSILGQGYKSMDLYRRRES